jgi:aspartate/methionine/tyrosine aminotransferase
MPPHLPVTISGRAATVKPFLAMEIMERAQALEQRGIDVVHLEIGEPDFDVPECVRVATNKALEGGCTHYTHSLGLTELRAEISQYYANHYGTRIDPERVIITTGTSGALVLVMSLLLNEGDDVLIPDPGYACYPNFVRAFGGRPRAVALDAAAGFRYDPSSFERNIGPRTRALLCNSPANPTAVVVEREVLSRLSELPVPIVSDEIYHGLHYGDRPTSILELTDNAYVLDGFSKRFAMTGMRIGWLVAPSDAVPTLQKLQQNLFICASSIAQHAALAALRDGLPALTSMRETYAERRQTLLTGLARLGLRAAAACEGAYYVLADARHLDQDSLRLARRLLEEAHVGVTPGIDFGARAEGHLRFSFASAQPRIEEGLERLEHWMRKEEEKITVV